MNIHASPLVLLLVLLCASATVAAQTDAQAPMQKGGYLLLMPTYFINEGDSAFDDDFGGVAGFGYRNGWYGFELAASYADRSGPSEAGGAINALLFPLRSLPGLYATVGAGLLRADKYPTGEDEDHFSLTTASGGLGYIIPMHFGAYEFGIRSEARYRYGYREERRNPTQTDLDASRTFKDILLGIGLHLPLGKKLVIPPPPAQEPAVVPPASVCADGQDNDGDSLIDFPQDSGCAAADDNDETDPPQCSDGKDNDGDGLIDFPSDKGCTGADDNDEVDPCKTPAPGERISLKGCGTGDIIVLRGVNFEFDKARLTANAKTILDNVAEELTAYREIKVELSGHTDAKGSDEYNQKLSEKRAASVNAYLEGKGIAADRMTSVGYGESKPVADNETDEGRELNRRVELKVIEGATPAAAPATPAAPAADTPVPTDPAATDGALPEAPAAEGAVAP